MRLIVFINIIGIALELQPSGKGSTSEFSPRSCSALQRSWWLSSGKGSDAGLLPAVRWRVAGRHYAAGGFHMTTD